MRNTGFITTALFAAALAFSTVAMAQQGAQQPPTPDVHVGDAELQSFAKASTAITEIQQDYSLRMQNADDPQAASELQQQANEKMVGAVEEAGLDVETFNMIATAVQSDPNLQQKLQQIGQ